MPSMPWIKIIFLLTALAVTSGFGLKDILGEGKYRWRCYFACVDQTGTQNDYVEQRDHCRELAQLKVDMAMKEANTGIDDKSRKAMLVTIFSQCMGTNGWTVPDGKGDGPKAVAGAVPAQQLTPVQNVVTTGAPVSVAAVSATKAEEKAALQRSSECAFARQSASVSSIAAARAHACDLQCAQALKMAPSAPRPASCPPDLPPKYSKGGVD
jgi:hypothetical protein